MNAMTLQQWNRVNVARADEGLGPFLGTYDNYLRLFDQQAAAMRKAKVSA